MVLAWSVAVAALVALGVLTRAYRSRVHPSAVERQFHGLFMATRFPTLIVDEVGVIINANPAAQSLLTPDGGALVGAEVDAFVPFRHRRGHEGLRTTFWTQPTERSMALGRAAAALRADGHEIPVEITLSPVRFGGGRAVLVTIVDLTGRSHTENELRRRTEELQRSNTALERFAWSASHDLQEPLRMITSYSQLLARRYGDALDDDGRQMVTYTVDGAARMQRLINELLAYARASQVDKQHVVTDMAAQWRAVLELLAAEIESSGAEIVLDAELPDVVADPVEVRQLLQNLVSNSLKYRSERPPIVRVSCTRTIDGFARVTVSDNGVGIEPRHHQKIFEAFQRLGDRAPGTGIGLALCKTVAMSHGGDIGVESSPGAGSTFWFTLPLARTEGT